MRAGDIQESISISEMFQLLSELGAEPIMNNDNEIIAKAICHGDDRYKLYYYDNSKRFTCYTNCGSGFSVFDLIQKVMGVGFIESLKIVKDKLNITESTYHYNEMPEMDFFKIFEKKRSEIIYDIIDENILNYFNHLYHISWINDGISSDAMRKYGIRFNIYDNQIIIPHYSRDNQLIGIRVRNLDKDVVDSGRKYMPLFLGSEIYTHSLRGNLYGLNVVEENIKRYKKIILFESEKAAMQVETMFPDNNIAVALSGSNLSNEQVDIINDLDVEEVIIAMDKEYEQAGGLDEQSYARNIRRTFINEMLISHKVSVIWDRDNLLDYKDAPSDKGKDVFIKLFNERIVISE